MGGPRVALPSISEPNPYGVTVKVPELVADPPAVVTVIFPVVAPLGTVAVILLSEMNLNVAAFTPKVTFVVCVRPVPLMVTMVPTLPLDGEKLLIVGVTLNCWRLFRLPLGRTTVTVPVLAPLGTVTVRFGSFLPSLFGWFQHHQSLLGSREPTLSWNQLHQQPES